MNRKRWYNKRKYADDYYEEKCSSKNKNGWKNKYDSDYGSDYGSCILLYVEVEPKSEEESSRKMWITWLFQKI